MKLTQGGPSSIEMGKPRYLFPNFLTDLNQLRESQLYWIRLSRDVLENNDQQNHWVIGSDPPQHDLSGFSSYGIMGGFSFDKTKGVAVNQVDPEQYDFETVAYTSESFKFSETFPTIYLEFTCKLSKDSADIFGKLFEKWIQSDCDRVEIERFIATLK